MYCLSHHLLVKRLPARWPLLSAVILIGLLIGALPAAAFDPNPIGGWADALDIDSDGKILVGGQFSEIAGMPRDRLARLNLDGTLDTSFMDTGMTSPSPIFPRANSVAVQTDDKILITGVFQTVGGVERRGIARLNPDGTVDTSFVPGGAWGSRGHRTATQADGKILAGGHRDFSIPGGTRYGLVRLLSDGSLDAAFQDPGIEHTNPNSLVVDAIVIQSDGKIIFGGSFTTVGGVGRSNLARLNPDGSLDETFDPSPDSAIRDLLIQPDGKILVAGGFGNIAGAARDRFARLHADGSIDTTFAPVSGGVNSSVQRLALQPDGKVLLGGFFSTIATDEGPVARNKLARVHADGTPDLDFDANIVSSSGTITDIRLQQDGRIIISGNFTQVGGLPRQSVARLHPDGAVDDGGPAELHVDPDPVVFGEVTVGEQSPRVVTLTNTGLSSMMLQGLNGLAPPFSAEDLGDSDCGSQGLSLEPDQSCVIEVLCAPKAEGAFSSTLEIESDAPGSPYELALSCEGTEALVSQLSLSPDTLTFPPVPIGTPSIERTTTLTSTGSIAVDVDMIDEAEEPFERVGGDCPGTPFNLQPAESCTLTYVFTPVEPDLATQEISISGSADPVTLLLGGLGQKAPVLVASPAAVDFGDIEVGQLAPAHTVTLTSSGSAGVTVSGIGSVSSPFARTGGNCPGTPFTLSPSQNCTLQYHFGPMEAGAFDQTVTIDSNTDAIGIELSGRGVVTVLPPHIDIDPEAVELTLESGDTGHAILLIGNLGEEDLVWTLLDDTRAGGLLYPLGAAPDCELPGWLALDPETDTVPGGDTGEADLAVNTAGLAVGAHEALLCIDSNDPERPLVTLPVNLNIEQAPPTGDAIFRDRFQVGEDG